MISGAPGATVEVEAVFRSGLAGTLAYRLIDNAGGTPIARTTAGITERVTVGSISVYTASVTLPATAGQNTLVWDDGTAELAAEDVVVTSSAESGALPSGADLCTLAQLRSYLQKPAADTAQDAIAQSIITRASRVIRLWTGREFQQQTAVTRRFRVTTVRKKRVAVAVSLSPYDLRTATTVKLHPETSAPDTLVATTDYLLAPEGAPQGTYLEILLGSSLTFASDVHSTFGFAYLDVLGDWGFPAIPEDVAHACIVTAGLWLRREVQTFSATFSLDEERLERPEALPSAVRAMLVPYRRPGFA